MAVVLIPIKDPAHAKQRLRAVLTQDERTGLAWAMLADVADAVSKARLRDAVFVVTSSSSVEAFARQQGWDVLEEESQLSESSSVDGASAELKRRGFERVMRLPGDVPLVRPADIDEVLQLGSEEHSSVIVPPRDGTGTNALLRTPPDAFPSRFGPGSFNLHQQEAASRGLRLVTLGNERLSLDIDNAEDLAAFFDRGTPSRTFDFLTSIGAKSRLEKCDSLK